jgi:3-dehydroquinate synthase
MAGKGCIITNPTVGALYLDAVRSSLDLAGIKVVVVEVPDGEQYKNSETLGRIYDGLIAAGLDRNGFIVALGGGVVGDMAGYAAATYLRGIPFVQIPTTLLSQVDSSVGGKTGINHPKGKNLIGAFYQPRQVIIDVAALDTLPRREYACGMAEVIKYGVVLDGTLFEYLQDNVELLLKRDKQCLVRVVKRCCELKARVVELDERESGLRAVLNYGHTVGHAVESLTGYTSYSHGEAVAIGMVAASRYSEKLGVATAEDTRRIAGLLAQFDLPTVLPPFERSRYEDAVRRDKKAKDGGITFVCNQGIGKYHFAKNTDPADIIVTGVE